MHITYEHGTEDIMFEADQRQNPSKWHFLKRKPASKLNHQEWDRQIMEREKKRFKALFDSVPVQATIPKSIDVVVPAKKGHGGNNGSKPRLKWKAASPEPVRAVLTSDGADPPSNLGQEQGAAGPSGGNNLSNPDKGNPGNDPSQGGGPPGNPVGSGGNGGGRGSGGNGGGGPNPPPPPSLGTFCWIKLKKVPNKTFYISMDRPYQGASSDVL